MGAFKIYGGNKLSGEIIPQGAKNEALQILCAVLLTPEEVTIRNIPDILDVNRLIDLLGGLGVSINKTGKNEFIFKSEKINLDYLKTPEFYKKATSIRGSVMLLGPLLARFGVGYLPQPGGDKIGRRRLDTHFIGLQKLGAEFQYDEAEKCYHIKAPKLTGNYMLLEEASVTGTANILMTAVMAKGKTTIFNAASEPYLVQLCQMLNRMGAKINGVGSNLLKVEGVSELGGTTHTMLADMIEVGSFIGLAAMTQSSITIKNVDLQNLGMIPDIFRRIGVTVEQKGLMLPILVVIVAGVIIVFFIIFKGRSAFLRIEIPVIWMSGLTIFGLGVWFLTAPDIRFGMGLFWLLACLLASVVLVLIKQCPCHLVKRITLGIIIVIVAFALIRKVSGLLTRLPDSKYTTWSTNRDNDLVDLINEGLSPLPSVKMWKYTTFSGLQLNVPVEGNQIWDAPLLSSPHPSMGLMLRNPEDISTGFKSEGQWRPYGYPILMYEWHKYVEKRLNEVYKR